VNCSLIVVALVLPPTSTSRGDRCGVRTCVIIGDPLSIRRRRRRRRHRRRRRRGKGEGDGAAVLSWRMNERKKERTHKRPSGWTNKRATEQANERTSGCQRLGIFPRQVSLGHPYRVDTTKAGQRRVFDCASRVLQSELTRSSDHSASGKSLFLSLSLSLSLYLYLYFSTSGDGKISLSRKRHSFAFSQEDRYQWQSMRDFTGMRPQRRGTDCAHVRHAIRACKLIKLMRPTCSVLSRAKWRINESSITRKGHKKSSAHPEAQYESQRHRCERISI